MTNQPQPPRVFVYGTLLQKPVVQNILGYTPEGEDALLNHYHRRALAGRHYPGIAPADADTVKGLLYPLQQERDLNLLDDYEGDEYDRITEYVTLTGKSTGDSLLSWVYVIRPTYRHLLLSHDWAPHRF